MLWPVEAGIIPCLHGHARLQDPAFWLLAVKCCVTHVRNHAKLEILTIARLRYGKQGMSYVFKRYNKLQVF
jgi:hypothetical protein